MPNSDRQGIEFVDLNCDQLVKVSTRANFTGLDHLWLARNALILQWQGVSS